MKMTSVHANGILRHCFFGTYTAVIGLTFESETHKQDAKKVLGNSWSDESAKRKNILVWSGTSEELDEVKKVLVKYGADEKKIDSIAKSIDYGEPFEVNIPIVPNEQLPLF
jgi:hypothetical protein